MTVFSPPLLLVVFVTHLPFFAWRYWKTREPRYAATSLTFSLLALTYGLRVFAPEAVVRGVPWFWIARIPAWGAATVSIAFLVHHHAGRWATRPSKHAAGSSGTDKNEE